MKDLLLVILAISLTFISFNLALRSVEPVHAAPPFAPPFAPPVNDIITMLRPPRVIIMPQRDKGGYSDYDHMKCLKQAQLEPRGKKRNDARKNCNQSLQ